MESIGKFRLKELIAAPFTPLLADGEINFPLIEEYADYLVKAHFTGIFNRIWLQDNLVFSIGRNFNGSLAEGMSMTLDERKRLAVAWKKASKGRLQLVVHVGTNSIKDSQELARHAGELGADAIAAYAPSYYKPENEEVMVDVMEQIAGAAPKTPFYYYDINFMTGCYINVRKFLELAKDRIPTLRGLKHSSRSLPSAHDCTLIENGNMQVLMGTNEQYLTSLTLGMPGVVIVSYLGPLFHDLRKAFDAGDLKTALEKQVLCQKVQNIRNKYGGGMSTAKSIFTVLTGIDVGPVRLPLKQLCSKEIDNMQADFLAAGLNNIAMPV